MELALIEQPQIAWICQSARSSRCYMHHDRYNSPNHRPVRGCVVQHDGTIPELACYTTYRVYADVDVELRFHPAVYGDQDVPS